MKIIEGHILTVGKVVCSCCGDSHYFILQRDRKRVKGGEVYYFDFQQEGWSGLRERLRLMICFLKHDGKSLFDGIMMTIEQLEDFWHLLKDDILTDVNGADCIKEVCSKEFNLESFEKTQVFNDKNWNTITLFQSEEDELVVTADTIYSEKDKVTSITDINIGWCIRQDHFKSKWQKFKYALSYLFKRRKYPVRENSACVDEKETRELLATIYGVVEYCKNIQLMTKGKINEVHDSR